MADSVYKRRVPHAKGKITWPPKMFALNRKLWKIPKVWRSQDELCIEIKSHGSAPILRYLNCPILTACFNTLINNENTREIHE